MASSDSTARERDALAYDGRFELWLATALARRLEDDPPPIGSRVGAEWGPWAERLAADGRERLAEAGIAHHEATSC